MAGASTIALGALLATISPAEAGRCPTPASGVSECTEAAGTDSTQTIAVGSGETLRLEDDDTFGLNVASGKGIVVTTVTGSDAVTLDLDGDISAQNEAIDVNQIGTGAVSITTDGDITSTAEEGIVVSVGSAVTGSLRLEINGNVASNAKRAIYSLHNGTGETVVETGSNSVLTSTGTNAAALRITNFLNSNAQTASSQDITITADGDIGTASSKSAGGIYVTQRGFGETNVTVNGDVFVSDTGAGVHVGVAGIGVVDVTVAGNVDGGTHGVRVNTSNLVSAAVPVTLATSGSIEGDIGILVNSGHANDSATTTISGSVTGNDGTAVDLDGPGDHTLVLEAGASFTGSLDASGATGTTTLELGGTDSGTFDIDDLGTGFDSIVKNTDATWTITGSQSAGAAVTDTNINAGRLVLDTGAVIRSTNISVADGATLEVMDEHLFSGTTLTLSGVLKITGSGSYAGMRELVGNGGEVNVDVDFSGGDQSLAVGRITVVSASGDPITVNVRALGGFPTIDESDEDGRITITNFIQSLNAVEADDFSAGVPVDDEGMPLDNAGFRFELVPATNSWSLVATPVVVIGGGGAPLVAAGPSTIFDTLPAVLSDLARIDSMQKRLQNRSFRSGTNIWGRISTQNSEIEPSAAAFETKQHAVQFGVEVPLSDVTRDDFARNVSVDAHVGVSTAETEAFVTVGETTDEDGEMIPVGGNVDIETNGIEAGVAVTWSQDGAYVDAQATIARYDNDLDASTGDGPLASPSANAFAGGIEVGYAFDAGDLNFGDWLGDGAVPNIILTPSAQLSWSRVEFNDYTASDDTGVSLDDGDMLVARVGATATSEWQGVVLHDSLAPARTSLHGFLDVLMPIDGEVGTKVTDEEGTALMLSEREDPFLDIGIAGLYTWELDGHAYTLSAGISTQQGEEVEGYEASAGFKYRF